MDARRLIFTLAPAIVMTAAAQEAAPEKALKYHEALMKRPQNAALFDRFYGAWIDEQPLERLEAFLVSQAGKNGGQAWSVLARYQLRCGQEEQALGSLAKAIEATPDDVTLPMERAKIHLRRLEFDSARADLAKVAAGNDEALALEAAKSTGKAWLREGRSDEAVKAWDALLAKHPGDEDLLEDLVENAAAEGETTQALAYIAKLINASKDPYKKTLRSLRRGDLLAQSGKVDEAVGAYGATLAQVGEGSWLEREILAQIDKIFRKQDRLNDLAEQLKKLAEANPRRFLIHRQLAKLEAVQGETDAAIGRFREVLKRSPGDREMREEFVKMLADGERFDDAAAEMEKMVELTPADAGLQLQLASLRYRQGKHEAVLAALEKAHELLGKDGGNGIRIAGQMLQYELAEEGEALLKSLAAAADAGPAPAETLAAHYGRTNRRNEALELLKKIGATDDMDVLIRVAGSVSALGDNEAALAMLSAKTEKFTSEPRFLNAYAQAAMAAKKPQDAVNQAVKWVRLSKQTPEITESVSLAMRVLVAAEKVAVWRASLEAQASRTAAETCLLAALTEGDGDFDGVTKLLGMATDPVAVRFYASLLDRRGEFETAIAALSRLADTDEGRKAAFFKDLSELQQRSGKPADALATVERWKLSAPGDKAAWIAASRLLRESGKPEEAVKTMRQAVARFEGDADLAANLATLHEESGQWSDAEAIYWRLYDEGQNPSDQGRWAAQLAQLAMRTGQTQGLEEKLQERARGNRRSIGPILALAELARVTNNEDKRRDLLLEAVRLQPKDVDLRLQIANLEEQAGNQDRVIAVLEEAVANDTTGRIRAALGQAYVQQGQVIKGLRELQALSGKNARDPRAIELTVATLAGAGMYEEAINFLRESIPNGGDWRSQYLLAVMLEHDGRESEALPIFVSLQKADGDLPGVKPNPNGSSRYIDHYPGESRQLMRLMMASQMAYLHLRDPRRGGMYFGGSATTGPFSLPEDAATARLMALTHLGKLAEKGGPEMQAQLLAAGINRLGFVSDFLAASNAENGRPNYLPLLKKYPQEPGLLDLTLMFPGNGGADAPGADVETLRKVLENSGKANPSLKFRIWMMIVHQNNDDDAAWTSLLDSAQECLASKDPKVFAAVASQMIYQMATPQRQLPEKHRESVKKLILGFATTPNENDDPKFHMEQVRLSGLAVAGTREQWIDAFNAMVKSSRAKPANAASTNPYQMQGRGYGMSGYHRYGDGQNPFILPTLNTVWLSSLPGGYQYQIRPKNDQNAGHYGGNGFDAGELVKFIDRFESPLVRAWVAICANDAAATEKALSVTPPKEEAADFVALRAYQAVANKNYPEAYQLLDRLKSLRAAERAYASSLSLAMVAVATEMKSEQREKISESLKAVLVQCRQLLGNEGAPILAAQAKQLGYEDLAKRFQVVGTGPNTPSTLGPAGFARTPTRSSSSSRSSRSSGSASVERMMKLSSDKKYGAAARDALTMIRQAKSNRHGGSNSTSEWLTKLPTEVRDELTKLVDPGDSKSLTKRLEYAEVSALLGNKQQALATFESLAKERPGDTTLAMKMVFLLPSNQPEKAVELMTLAAQSQEFPDEVASKINTLYQGDRNNHSQAIEFYEIISAWLEQAAPEALEKINLTWVSFHGKNFLERNPLNLLHKLPEKAGETPHFERRVAVAKRLALAMVKHSMTAEEGFRLLKASHAWELTPEELDAKARETVARLKLDDGIRRHNAQFFTWVHGGGSSSEEDLAAHSSIGWLTERMAKTKSSDEILPPGYLIDLNAKNPEIGNLVSALSELSTLEQIGTLWDTDALKLANSPTATMLRQAIMTRAGSVPGASKFFANRLAELKPEAVAQDLKQGKYQTIMLMSAALTAGVAGNPRDLEDVCKGISRVLFGEKVDWENFQDLSQNASYYRFQALERLLSEQSTNRLAAMKLIRTLFRLGIPIGDDEYDAYRTFQNGGSFQKPEDAEAFFESIGFLDDISTWEPAAGWVMKTQYSNGKTTYRRTSVLLNEKIPNYINRSFSTSDLVKRLKERQPATFGALITAASFTSGERQQLTAAAFAAAAPALAKMPKDRIEGFALLLPWLPADATAKLPPAFKAKAAELQEVRRKQWVKVADEFLTNNDPQQWRNGNDPFNAIGETVNELISLDLNKSVALFLEAEKRYTESLSRGGRYSDYTANNIQVSMRDRALSALLRGDKRSPFLSLRFLTEVLKSPQGSRFSLASIDYTGLPLLTPIGGFLQNRVYSPSEPTWLIAAKMAVEMPEDVRGDALVAAACFSLDHHPRSNAAKEAQQNALALPGLLQQALPYLAMAYIPSWANDTAEGKAIISNALASILADVSVSHPARTQLAIAAVTKCPHILSIPEVATSVTSLFKTYCEGERSAVNPMVMALMEKIAETDMDAASLPAARRIHESFWANASSVKPGGHAEIPPETTNTLLRVAVLVGDATTAKKLFINTKSSLVGDLNMIIKLLRAQQFDMVKLLLPEAGRLYRRGPNNELRYDRLLEEQLASFAKEINDPEQTLRLECVLLGLPDTSGELAPRELKEKRGARLAAVYLANSPKNNIGQLEMLSAISGSSKAAKSAVGGVIRDLAKSLNLESALQDRARNDDQAQPMNQRNLVARLEYEIFQEGAMLDLAQGDAELFEKMCHTLATSPDPGAQPNVYSSYAFSQCFAELVDAAVFACCASFASGTTAGLDRALNSLEPLTIKADGTPRSKKQAVKNAVILCQFLARINQQPERTTKLLEKFTCHKKLGIEPTQPDGFADLIIMLHKGRRGWLEISYPFMTRLFSRPELFQYFPIHNDWTERIKKEVDGFPLAYHWEELPTFSPQVRVLLKNNEGDRHIGQNPGEAVFFYSAAVKECPADASFDGLREMCRFNWAFALRKSKTPIEAKAIYDEINAEKLSPAFKTRYQKLGTDLAHAEQP